MTTVIRAYMKPGRPACSVDGCAKTTYCKGYCTLHYNRLRKDGVVGAAAALCVSNGAGSVDSYGYRILSHTTHPLAGSQGKVPEHRAVLYDARAGAARDCHWCAKPLQWKAGRQSERVNVDHLDWNRLNNAVSNLVPSCLACNTQRRQVAA